MLWVFTSNQRKALSIQCLDSLYQLIGMSPACVMIQEAWKVGARRSKEVANQCHERGWTVIGNEDGSTVTICMACQPQQVV